MSPKVHWLCVVVLLFLGATALASAQEPSLNDEHPPSGVCAEDAVCAEHAARGREMSRAGMLADALSEYQAAYAQKPDPKLLFNLARVLHRLGRYSEAVDFYQRFVYSGAETHPEQLAKTRTYLEEAQHLAAGAAPSAPSPAATTSANPPKVSGALAAAPPPSRGRPVYKKWWFWTLLVGTAAVAGGVTAGVILGTRGSPNGTGTPGPINIKF